MLRPFIRAGVLDARDPTLVIPAVGTAPFISNGTLTAIGVAKMGSIQHSTGTPHFSGGGSLGANGVGVMSGGGTGATIKYAASDVTALVGIDTHWSYSSYQGKRAQLITAINDIGIKHIRDRNGSNTIAAMGAGLASAGVKATVIAGAPWGGGFISSVSSAISTLKSSSASYYDFIEGPNEPDMFGGSNYASTTRTWMQQLYPAVRGDSWFNGIPVMSPAFAFPSGLTTYGKDSNNDYCNMHCYMAGDIPESSKLQTWIGEAQAQYGVKPLSITEWGYHSDTSTNGVDQNAYRDYLIRAIFWNLIHDVKIATSYELMDESDKSGREAHFGILYSDGSYKPVATSLKNLLSRVRDTGTGTLITKYPYSYTTSGSDVKVVPLGRRDGAIDFAVWRAAPLFNFSSYTDLAAPSPVAVNFTIGSAKSAVAYRVNTGASTTLTSNSTTFTVQADGTMQLVRVS